MKEFKVGDKVYCPIIGNKVYKLSESISLSSFMVDKSYPIGIEQDSHHTPFTANGFYLPSHKKPSLLHATAENHAKLEAFYEEEFEKPPAPPTSKEIIQAMLERGDKFVACWVSNIDEYPSPTDCCRLIATMGYLDDDKFCSIFSKWKYATPFDIRTGKPITELPT